jgi:hypothetical protein
LNQSGFEDKSFDQADGSIRVQSTLTKTLKRNQLDSGQAGPPTLTRAQYAVLAQITDVLNEITAEATPTLLRSLMVLNRASQEHLDTFHDRFSALPNRLKELLEKGRIVVNKSLPAGMGACTVNGFEDDGTPFVQLQLLPSFLDRNSMETPTHRAVTLIHELSHALLKNSLFPVRDYTYRDSWAHGVILPDLAIENGDTYADVAAHIADLLPGSAPGMYTERGRTASQRRALAGMDRLNVGPALAWAALKINRAWLRAGDYAALARFTISPSKWDEKVNIWKKHNPAWYGLWELEAYLRGHLGLIGKRYGYWNYGLATDDRKIADNMTAFMLTIKGTLDELNPVLVLDGEIAYDDTTKELRIPYGLASSHAVQLGELILQMLAAKTEIPGGATDLGRAKLEEVKEILLNKFVEFDRPQEKARVDQQLTELRGLPVPTTKDSEWQAAAVALDIALIEGTSSVWEQNALLLPGTDPETLKNLHEAQAKVIARVKAACNRLGAQEPVRRRAAISSMVSTLRAFAAKLTPSYPSIKDPYDKMIEEVIDLELHKT